MAPKGERMKRMSDNQVVALMRNKFEDSKLFTRLSDLRQQETVYEESFQRMKDRYRQDTRRIRSTTGRSELSIEPTEDEVTALNQGRIPWRSANSFHIETTCSVTLPSQREKRAQGTKSAPPERTRQVKFSAENTFLPPTPASPTKDPHEGARLFGQPRSFTVMLPMGTAKSDALTAAAAAAAAPRSVSVQFPPSSHVRSPAPPSTGLTRPNTVAAPSRYTVHDALAFKERILARCKSDHILDRRYKYLNRCASKGLPPKWDPTDLAAHQVSAHRSKTLRMKLLQELKDEHERNSRYKNRGDSESYFRSKVQELLALLREDDEDDSY